MYCVKNTRGALNIMKNLMNPYVVNVRMNATVGYFIISCHAQMQQQNKCLNMKDVEL